MKVIIMGAGQLGSRHLQALRNIPFDLDITVSDPSLESLKVAKERYESLPEVGKHRIQFLENLPTSGDWDLAIVATNSGPRRNILQHTAESLRIKNFILEKILFTKTDDYEWAGKNLKNAWVNCCMRQMPVYAGIKANLLSQKFNFVVSGSNYGMITNAIHYLDYASWLAGTTDFTLQTTNLSERVIPSKRKGYVELNGTLTASFKSGAVAQLTCFAEGSLPIAVEVHSDRQRYLVLEAERRFISWNTETSWKPETSEAVIPFQSSLTTKSVQAFYENRACGLTPLDESIRIHLNLLNPLKDFLIRTNQVQTEEFPFT